MAGYEAIDYEETFSPIARMATVRAVIAMAAAKGWSLHHVTQSNIVLAHMFVTHLSRPWATRGKGIGENGLRAILGLGLPSKGLGIKDKSC